MSLSSMKGHRIPKDKWAGGGERVGAYPMCTKRVGNWMGVEVWIWLLKIVVNRIKRPFPICYAKIHETEKIS